MFNRKIPIRRELAVFAFFCVFTQIVIGQPAFAEINKQFDEQIVEQLIRKRLREQSATITHSSSVSSSSASMISSSSSSAGGDNSENDSDLENQHEKKKRKRTSLQVGETDESNSQRNVVDLVSEDELQQEQTHGVSSSSSSAHPTLATASSSSVVPRMRKSVNPIHKDFWKALWPYISKDQQQFDSVLAEIKKSIPLLDILENLRKLGALSPEQNEKFSYNVKCLGPRQRTDMRFNLIRKFNLLAKRNESSSSKAPSIGKFINPIHKDFWEALWPYISKDQQHFDSALAQIKKYISFPEVIENLTKLGALSPEQNAKFTKDIKFLTREQLSTTKFYLKRKFEFMAEITNNVVFASDSKLQQEQTYGLNSLSSLTNPSSVTSSSSSSSHVMEHNGTISLPKDRANDLANHKDEGFATFDDRAALLKLISLASEPVFLPKMTIFMKGLENKGVILSSEYDSFEKNCGLLNDENNRYKFIITLTKKLEESKPKTTFSSSSSVVPKSVKSLDEDFWRTLSPSISSSSKRIDSAQAKLKKSILVEKQRVRGTESIVLVSEDEDSENELKQEQTHGVSSSSSSSVPTTVTTSSSSLVPRKKLAVHWIHKDKDFWAAVSSYILSNPQDFDSALAKFKDGVSLKEIFEELKILGILSPEKCEKFNDGIKSFGRQHRHKFKCNIIRKLKRMAKKTKSSIAHLASSAMPLAPTPAVASCPSPQQVLMSASPLQALSPFDSLLPSLNPLSSLGSMAPLRLTSPQGPMSPIRPASVPPLRPSSLEPLPSSSSPSLDPLAPSSLPPLPLPNLFSGT